MAINPEKDCSLFTVDVDRRLDCAIVPPAAWTTQVGFLQSCRITREVNRCRKFTILTRRETCHLCMDKVGAITKLYKRPAVSSQCFQVATEDWGLG